LRIHTGLPRHSTIIMSPGASLPISTSTGAPAALARSEGIRLETKGVNAVRPRAPPTPTVAIIHCRRAWLSQVVKDAPWQTHSDMTFSLISSAFGLAFVSPDPDRDCKEQHLLINMRASRPLK
jgi:hypothetical protein